MCSHSRSAGAITPEPSAALGVRTKPTSTSKAAGHISTEPWISWENRGFLSERQAGCGRRKQFLRKALQRNRVPSKITPDAYVASHRAELKAANVLPRRVRVR